MPNVIGIDISIQSIRVLVGEVKKSKLAIIDGFGLKQPKLKNGEIENFDEIIEQLLEVLEMKNGKKTTVNVLFPSKSIQNKLIQIPIVDDKTLKKSMATQIQQTFGAKDKQLSNLTHVMDYGVYGTVDLEKSRQLAILMSIIGKDVALNCVEAFNKYKFRVKVIDSQINNMYFALELVNQKREPIHMAVQLLNNETSILFLSNNKPVFQRNLKFGIESMIRDRDKFFENIFRTIESFRSEYKIEIENMVILGDITDWFVGVKDSFKEVLMNSGENVLIKEWELKPDTTITTNNLEVVNETDIHFDSSYASAFGLLVREVIK